MIYVYRFDDSRIVRLLDSVVGLRYWAYDAPWPQGRRIANGWTIKGTVRRARRRLARDLRYSFGPPVEVYRET